MNHEQLQSLRAYLRQSGGAQDIQCRTGIDIDTLNDEDFLTLFNDEQKRISNGEYDRM